MDRDGKNRTKQEMEYAKIMLLTKRLRDIVLSLSGVLWKWICLRNHAISRSYNTEALVYSRIHRVAANCYNYGILKVHRKHGMSNF